MPSRLIRAVPVPRLRRRKRAVQPGSRPGELVIHADQPKPELSVLAYDEQSLVEKSDIDLDDVAPLLEGHSVTWLNVEGFGDKALLEDIGQRFALHPLALEDIVNVPQRPKVEPYDDQLFIIVQLLTRAERIEREQLSILVGERFVLTFGERPGDPFDPVRERLREGRGRLRSHGSGYLAYALLDAAIDHYFPVLDAFRDHLEDLESMLRVHRKDGVERVQAARTELVEARQAVAPLRDVTRTLLREKWPLLSETTLLHIRDCHDHVLEAFEQLETCREIASSLMDVHLSTVSHQANQKMKVLTIVSAIFMPLSFLAGVYGMNFDTEISRWNLPELSSPIGYPVLLGVMVAIGVGLLVVFWRSGWFE